MLESCMTDRLTGCVGGIRLQKNWGCRRYSETTPDANKLVEVAYTSTHVMPVGPYQQPLQQPTPGWLSECFYTDNYFH